MAGRQVDEKVEVAVSVGLSAGDGPQDADRARAVALGDCQDLLAPGTDRVESECHGRVYRGPLPFQNLRAAAIQPCEEIRAVARFGAIAELESAPIPSHGRGQGFESPPLHTRVETP